MKLEVFNEWEYLTYRFNGMDINEKAGGEAVLTTGETIKFRSVEDSKEYNDMGHTYESIQRKLIATIDFNNQQIDVELTKLDIEKIIQRLVYEMWSKAEFFIYRVMLF